MPWREPQYRPVGYVIKKVDDWDVIIDDLLYLKEATDNALARANDAWDLGDLALRTAKSAADLMGLTYWDVAKVATFSVTGGTINGNGPLWRGKNDYWLCDSVGQVLTVDLQSSYSLVGVAFGTFPRGDPSRVPSSFTVEHSVDGANWATLADITGNTKTFVNMIHTVNDIITPFEARYVKITINAFQDGQTAAYISGLKILSADNAAGFGDSPFLVDADGATWLTTGRELRVAERAVALASNGFAFSIFGVKAETTSATSGSVIIPLPEVYLEYPVVVNRPSYSINLYVVPYNLSQLKATWYNNTSNHNYDIRALVYGRVV